MSENPTKVCGLCGLRLQLKHFVPDKRTNDGLSTYCMDCRFAVDDGTPDDVINPYARPEVHCQKCGTFKPRDQFTPDPTRRNGAYPWCKECYNVYQREYRKNKPTYKPRLSDQMKQMIQMKYGESATALSVLRSPDGYTMAETVLGWFPDHNPDKVRRTFYELATGRHPSDPRDRVTTESKP